MAKLTGMKQVEERSRVRINIALADLGWILDGEGRNVLLGREISDYFPKIGRNEPDYVLMQSGSNYKPLAVVEAKKPNKKLDEAVKQARKYAEKIHAPLIFASDGSVVVAEITRGGFCFKHGERLEEFVNEEETKELADTGVIEASGETILNLSDLVRKFDEASNVLRAEGMNPGTDSVYEFCSVIFTKLISENESIPENYQWRNLRKLSGDGLVNQFKQAAKYFSKEYNDVLRKPSISNPETLEALFRIVNDIDFSATNIDVKGAAYEHLISKYNVAQKSPLGQFFTPRHVAKFMVKLLDPQEGETVYDPYCGTGGMLVQSYLHLYKTINKKNTADLQRLKEKSVFGGEIGDKISRIAKMNMVLIGDGHSNIKRIDSNKNPIDKKYNIVITNIPFNMIDVIPKIANLYGCDDKDANFICLKHCIKSLKPRGRGAIIVPITVAAGMGYQHASARKFLLDSVNVEAVLRLPPHTFKRYTSARTCILLVNNAHTQSTKDIVQIDIKNDGFSSDAWREPIVKNDLPSILNNINDFRSSYALHTPTEENDYSLVDTTQHEDNFDGVALGDLVDVKTTKTLLNPMQEYNEPRLSSASHRISSHVRLGKNIKDSKKGKVMVEPGDLVIATLHTQSGRGLFAISKDYYVATSQLILKIKDGVDANYLCAILRIQLPKMKVSGSDLVGRETYSDEELLAVRIPYPPSKETQKLLNEIDEFQSRFNELRKKNEKYPLSDILMNVSLENIIDVSLENTEI